MKYSHYIVIALSFVGLLLFPKGVLSFGLDDIQLNAGSSVDGECNNVDIQAILDKLDGSIEDRVIDEIKSSFSPKRLLPLISQIIQCYVSDLQVLEFGSGVSAPGNAACTRSIGGQIEAQLAAQFKDKIRQEFLDSCQAQANKDLIDNDIYQILNTNGRDGGPVWVQDWRNFQEESQARGLEIARNQLANTNYCPWVQGDMQGIYNFSATDAVALSNQWSDSGGSSTDANSCTFPDGFNVLDPSQQNTSNLAALGVPQNNIYGSYLSGLAALKENVDKESLADQYEFVSTGGLGALHQQNPQTGDSCLQRAPNGICLKYSTIIQPAAGVEANLMANTQSNYDLVTKGGPAVTDVRTKIATSFVDLTQPPSSFEYNVSLGYGDLTNRTPAPETPTPTPAPGTVPSACTDLPGDCTCVINDNSSQALAQTVILAAENSVITNHPELMDVDGVHVKAGQNIPFLDAVCADSSIPANTCRSRPASETDVILNVSGMDFDINILTSSGVVRKPGQVIAACTAGSL